MNLRNRTSTLDDVSLVPTRKFHYPRASEFSKTVSSPPRIPLRIGCTSDVDAQTMRNANAPPAMPFQASTDTVAVILPVSQLQLLEQHVQSANRTSSDAAAAIDNPLFGPGAAVHGGSTFDHRPRSDQKKMGRLSQSFACRSAGPSPFAPRQRLMGSLGMRAQMRQAVARLEAENGADVIADATRERLLELISQRELSFDIPRRSHLDLSGLDRADAFDKITSMRLGGLGRPASGPPTGSEAARFQLRNEMLLELQKQKRLQHEVRVQERASASLSTANRKRITDLLKEKESEKKAREWHRLYRCMIRSSKSHDPVATSLPKSPFPHKDRLYELLCRSESSRRIMLNLLEGKKIAVETSNDDENDDSCSTSQASGASRKRNFGTSDTSKRTMHLKDNRTKIVRDADNEKESPIAAAAAERRSSTGSDTTMTDHSSTSNPRPCSLRSSEQPGDLSKTDCAASMKLLALAQIACARVECTEGENHELEKNVYHARAG